MEICIRRDEVRMAAEKINDLKLFEWSYWSDMIHAEQENYALGTVNTVHADWDTDVNPT